MRGLTQTIRTFGLVLAAAQLAPAVADVVLVNAGAPAATIVVGVQASGQAKAAAERLQTYLERISGAKLDIRTETEVTTGNRLLVGQSQAVRDLGVEVPTGFSNEMNEEGFVLRTVGDALVLAGNEQWHYQGTTYAVSAFLEHLGCRWFFPGPYGEVIPTNKSISAGNLEREEHPDFRFRNIWYSGWMPVSGDDGPQLRGGLHRRVFLWRPK